MASATVPPESFNQFPRIHFQAPCAVDLVAVQQVGAQNSVCWKACCRHLHTSEEIAARRAQVADRSSYRLRQPYSTSQPTAPPSNPAEQGQSRPCDQSPTGAAATPSKSQRSSPIITRSRAAGGAAGMPPPVPSFNGLARKLKARVSTAPLTIPEDFEFRTTQRGARKSVLPQDLGERSPYVKSMASKVQDYHLRNSPQTKRTSTKRPRPSKENSEPQDFVPRSPYSGSLAGKVQHFATSLRSSTAGFTTTSGPKELTWAKDPNLRTAARSKPSRFKSREEMEEEEMQTMRPFKARRLNPAVVQSMGQVGVPRVDRKQATQPEPFQFKVDARAQAKAPVEEAKPPPAAAPKVHKYNTRSQAELTDPKSPMLMTKMRSQLKGGCATHQRQQTASKARSAAPAARGKGKFGLTIPTPFSLVTELRGKLHEDQFKSKVTVEDKENAQAHLFKAHPVPKVLDHPTGVPPITHRPPLTAVQPFALRSEARHAEFQAQRQLQLQQEQQEMRRAAEFKANPPPDPQHVFMPHPADKPVTVAVEHHFRTDARAVDRLDFDQRQEQRMRMMEEEKWAREDEQKRAKEAETAEFRRSIHFEAQPMPNFTRPAFRPVPSNKSLTAASTPDLSFRKHR